MSDKTMLREALDSAIRGRDEALADFANACDVGRRQEQRADSLEREVARLLNEVSDARKLLEEYSTDPDMYDDQGLVARVKAHLEHYRDTRYRE